MSYQTKLRIMAFLLILCIFTACQNNSDTVVSIKDSHIQIDFNKNMQSRVLFTGNGKQVLLTDFSTSDYLSAGQKEVTGFVYQNHSQDKIEDELGSGTEYKIVSASGKLQKNISIKMYNDYPGWTIFNISYVNNGKLDLNVDSWTSHRYTMIPENKNKPELWSYQSGSYDGRFDWVVALKDSFSRGNYMGMNSSDYGGGTPVVDIWRKDAGLIIGHLELSPKLVSLPVEVEKLSSGAKVALQYKKEQTIAPGESLNTFTTFIAVHEGDYFNALSQYSEIMQKRGIEFKPINDSAYEPVWCAWGYERGFTVDQILKTLPKVKEMGFEWAVLDDGWQTAEGDWFINKKKFPRGEKDMKDFVGKIESYGLKAKLWWAPLAVDPGTDLIKEHPEYLLLNKDGSTQDITWWDSYYLCPAYPPVREYTKKLVKKIMQDWGWKGLKIDGQHLNGAPPCYNPKHNHAYPEEAVEQVPRFFKTIYETALEIHKDAVVEICPCGTAYSFYNLPYMNQPVSSDPTSSWQVRLKGKTLKALMGESAPYYGDHVELSDGGTDFASSIGVGAVIGTKFTWPVGAHMNTESGDVSLTADRENEWQKWVDIYNKYQLPKGKYLGGLYDIGFDLPEGHAIEKDGVMFYAFYADKWDGKIELKGLDQEKPYRVTDYINGDQIKIDEGKKNVVNVSFEKYLLIKVEEIKL